MWARPQRTSTKELPPRPHPGRPRALGRPLRLPRESYTTARAHGNRSATKREGRRAPGDAGAPRNHRLREGAGLTGRGPCGSRELSRAQDATGTENRGAAARGWGGVGVTADRARAVPLDRRDGLQPDRGGVGTTRGSPGCRRALPFTWLTSCYMNAGSIKKPSRKCLIWQTG